MSTMTLPDHSAQEIVPTGSQDGVHMSPTPHKDDRLVRRRPRTGHRLPFMRQRELDGDTYASPDLLKWIEGETLRKLDTGDYIELDKSVHLVRSTINIAFSHDGRFFASTHGDHSVKVFEYPSRKQVACLEGHPHTPWSVRFHPHDSSIIASGCRGGECRVWSIPRNKCIRKHTFLNRISCVAFSPSGDFLAVTCGCQLLLWKYAGPTIDGCTRTRSVADAIEANAGSEAAVLPVKLLDGKHAFHLIDFHPSGKMIMTGESNRCCLRTTGRDCRDQFTLKVVVRHYDETTMGINLDSPVLVVPHAVAYNDAGIHFSECGSKLAACVPVDNTLSNFQIAILSLTVTRRGPIGTTLCSTPLDKGHVSALTNLKFSSTGHHLLAGFSFPRGNPVLCYHAEHYDVNAALSLGEHGEPAPRLGPCGAPMHSTHPQVHVVDIYRVDKSMRRIRSLGADIDMNDHNVGSAEDEINVAVFAPASDFSEGIVYGTQKGRIRMFQLATGKKAFPPGVCDENCNFQKPQPFRRLVNPTFLHLTPAATSSTYSVSN